jgi:hypothetical protein
MEYKEVEKKDGSKLVFCNFETLLEEFYGVSSMEEVKPFLNSNDEYIIHCPFCKEAGHTKHKLYIKGDLTVGFCFVCCRKYINVTDEVTVKVREQQFLPGLYRKPFSLVRLDDPEWSLDKFKFEFDDFSEVGYNYLLGRHKYLGELYKILGFKFMDGNVAMPFFYHGELFYYQIRFSGNSKIRYFFPPISAKPPYIIEHGDNKKFIVCEGVYDAIACLIMAPEYTPCAVLGSSVSDYEIEFLREYVPEKILVYMDKTSISEGIVKKLRSVIDYCPISIIRSDGEDPEECMKRKMGQGVNLQWIK